MNYATVKTTDVANGPGVRVSLYVSGCTHHCKGCFNSETWDFNFGAPYTQAVQDEILNALEPSYIRGLTVLGGEPFEVPNRKAVSELIKEVRTRFPQKDIWCYTGYNFEKDIQRWIKEGDDTVREMIDNLDVLVDGEFVEELKNLRLAFRGSENQRLIDVKRTMSEGRIVVLDL